jgi:hypothetical protein
MRETASFVLSFLRWQRRSNVSMAIPDTQPRLSGPKLSCPYGADLTGELRDAGPCTSAA